MKPTFGKRSPGPDLSSNMLAATTRTTGVMVVVAGLAVPVPVGRVVAGVLEVEHAMDTISMAMTDSVVRDLPVIVSGHPGPLEQFRLW